MNRYIINEIIRNRKTVYPTQFLDKEIPVNIINEILENAIHAPTHKMTQPWFFVVYRGVSKNVLLEIFNKLDKDKYSKIKIDKFMEKIKLSDTIISVFMNRDQENRIPEWEEVAAVSMAIQNIWLSCYVNNIGSYWSTSPMKDEYAKYANQKKNLRSLGFFFMGSYKHTKSTKVRESVNKKVKWV